MASQSKSQDLFDIKKFKILHDLEIPELTDLSPKGSVDEPIKPLMAVLNEHEDFVTTSSCSGRVAVYCQPDAPQVEEVKEEEEEGEGEGDAALMKGGGHWFYVTHDPIPAELLAEGATFDPIPFLFGDLPVKTVQETKTKETIGTSRLIWLDFEPMVLHTQCRTLDRARQLAGLAIQLGYRNSGLVIGNKLRYMVGIRSSIKLDVPIGIFYEGVEEPYVQLLVDVDYLMQLLHLANSRFDNNFSRMERLRLKLLETFQEEAERGDVAPVESKEDRRLRKRMEGLKLQQQKQAEKEQQLANADSKPDEDSAESLDN